MLLVVQLHSWQPGIKNPYRGMVVWPVPENIDISVTLFKVTNVSNKHLQTGDKVQALAGWVCIKNLCLIKQTVLLLFRLQELNAEQFEDKEWTFVLEGVCIALPHKSIKLTFYLFGISHRKG